MTLQEKLVDEIRDLYHAEKQLVKALPKMAKNATHDDLREAFEAHLEETREQVARLEEVFGALGEKPRAKPCHGMMGIVEEGNETIQELEAGAVLDAALIAAAQRVEHYEIGAYGTCSAWARLLGLDEVVTLLDQTLEEEKATDKKLTALAEQEVNLNAANEGGEEGEEMEGEEEEEQSGSRRGSATRGQSSSIRSSSRAKAADRRRR
jgi:ferritin-like metal-binding protein YciE